MPVMTYRKEDLKTMFELLDLAIRSGYNLEQITQAYVQAGEEANRSVVGSADSVAMEYANKHGYDVLTSNTSGVRSNVELAAGRPFWLGLASQCVAVAVIHRNVGIAGAHLVTVKPSDIKSGLLHILSLGSDVAHEELNRIYEGGHEIMVASLVTLKSRFDRVDEAIEKAGSLYRTLAAGSDTIYPPWVGITGMNYGTEEEQQQVSLHAHATVQKYFPGSVTDIRIGLAGGIVYGGPVHESLYSPAIISQ